MLAAYRYCWVISPNYATGV